MQADHTGRSRCRRTSSRWASRPGRSSLGSHRPDPFPMRRAILTPSRCDPPTQAPLAETRDADGRVSASGTATATAQQAGPLDAGTLLSTPHHSQQNSHPLGWLLRSTPHLLQRINTSTQPSCSQDHGWSINGQEFDLASCCFRRGLPPNYHRRCCVSQPSSRWIGVGPQRYGHQDSLDPQVSPENCIGDRPLTLSRQLTVGKTSLESSCGQALGLLVLLRFTHYCAST